MRLSVPDMESNSKAIPNDCAHDSPSPTSSFHTLPTEIRLKIWSCAVEPRIILLDDLVQKRHAYPLPAVAQLDVEARLESRKGYQHVGSGSFLHHGRDIMVCDCSMDARSRKVNPFVEDLALRTERLVFWDCFPDDGPVTTPYDYAVWLAQDYGQPISARINFGNLLFPNLRELWVIKVGDIDPAWKVRVDRQASHDVRLKQVARHFQYWIDENIVEMATLDLDDPDLPLIMREGRCSLKKCEELNWGRDKIISKVTFLDGEYCAANDGRIWSRIPGSPQDKQGPPGEAEQNSLRWALVERTLTYSLMWDIYGETDHGPKRRRIIHNEMGLNSVV